MKLLQGCFDISGGGLLSIPCSRKIESQSFAALGQALDIGIRVLVGGAYLNEGILGARSTPERAARDQVPAARHPRQLWRLSVPRNGCVHIVDKDRIGEKGLDNGPHKFVTAHNLTEPTAARRILRLECHGLKCLVDDHQHCTTRVGLFHHGQGVHRSRPSSHDDRIGEIAEHGRNRPLGTIVDVDLLGEGAHDPRHSRVHHNGSGVRPLQAEFECLAGGFSGGSLALHTSLLLSQLLHLGVSVF